jgi:hypothetical protein
MVRRLQESPNLPLNPLLRRRHWPVSLDREDCCLLGKNLRHRRQHRAEELKPKEMRFVEEARKPLNSSKRVRLQGGEWLIPLWLSVKTRLTVEVKKLSERFRIPLPRRRAEELRLKAMRSGDEGKKLWNRFRAKLGGEEKYKVGWLIPPQPQEKHPVLAERLTLPVEVKKPLEVRSMGTSRTVQA